MWDDKTPVDLAAGSDAHIRNAASIVAELKQFVLAGLLEQSDTARDCLWSMKKDIAICIELMHADYVVEVIDPMDHVE